MEMGSNEMEAWEGAVGIEIIGGRGEIQNCHEGQCRVRNGHLYVLFQEELTEDGGKGKTVFSSRLKISEDQVTLRRNLADGKGSTSPVMEFLYREQKEDEPGCFVNYPTPYGVMQLEIRTRELRIDRSEREICLFVRYVMLQSGQEISEDKLKVRITK